MTKNGTTPEELAVAFEDAERADGRITRSLPVQLTDAELLERGSRLAELEQEIANLDDARKEAARSYRDRLKELREQLPALTVAIASGTETRGVECEQVKDVREGVMRFVRLDTQEECGTRPLADAERQVTVEDVVAQRNHKQRRRKQAEGEI